MRDIHLENFSVSNGGAELIEDGTCTLAWGRRWGEASCARVRACMVDCAVLCSTVAWMHAARLVPVQLR